MSETRARTIVRNACERHFKQMFITCRTRKENVGEAKMCYCVWLKSFLLLQRKFLSETSFQVYAERRKQGFRMNVSQLSQLSRVPTFKNGIKGKMVVFYYIMIPFFGDYLFLFQGKYL